MDLMLLTNEEYSKLHRDIQYEPITYEYTSDALTHLYNLNYSRIIMTKRYVDTVGSQKVINAFKALMHMTYQFSSRVYLLSHRKDKLDKSVEELGKIGVKPLYLDVKDMTYQQFLNLDEMVRIDVTEYMGLVLPTEVHEVIDDIKSLGDEALRQYAALNYDKLTTTVLKCENLLKSYETLQENNLALNSDNLQLLKSVEILKGQLSTERYSRSCIESDLDKAKKFIMHYAESIQQYNNVLNKSQLNDEFVFRNKNRNTLVIYFKEYEDIGFFKVYRELYNNFRDIQGWRVKSLVVENRQRKYYNPYKGYKSLGLEPSVRDIILNDELVKYGNALKIIDVLTRPQYELQILFVLDRTYNTSTCIDMENQITYFLGKRREDYEIDASLLYDENFISPYEGDYMDLAYLYRDVDNLPPTAFKLCCNRSKFTMNLIELSKRELNKIKRGVISDKEVSTNEGAIETKQILDKISKF